MIKPPLGVTPHWFVLPKRIEELSEAISRYSKHEEITDDVEVTKVIKKWCIEIIGHCDTIDKIREENNK